MKALVKSKPERGIWMEDIPEPTVGHNDVLIKISRTAICGTDIHIYQWDEWAKSTIPVPLAVGHEFAGEIVEVGSEVKGFVPGDRVSAEPEQIEEDLKDLPSVGKASPVKLLDLNIQEWDDTL